MSRPVTWLLLSCLLVACTKPANNKKQKLTNSENCTVLASEDIQWQALNPARGDKSPQAGALWGGLKGQAATGFLAKFVDGFSSPPHFHNVTYRAVVIQGLVHNAHPNSPKMWMPAGSFWTQPAGQTHITAAKGEVNIALVEIDHGPYLVKPPKDAFKNPERPINVDKRNLVWVKFPESWTMTQSNQKAQQSAESFPEIAYLWGKIRPGRRFGSFLKLPAGFKGQIQSLGNDFKAVVIQGSLSHHKNKLLKEGSYFGASGSSVHTVATQTPTILYINTDGEYRLHLEK